MAFFVPGDYAHTLPLSIREPITYVFSPNRPHWADSVIESPCPSFFWLSVCAIGCSLFWSLSLALRSHDQFPGLSLVLPSLPPSLETWKLGNLETWILGNLETRNPVRPSHRGNCMLCQLGSLSFRRSSSLSTCLSPWLYPVPSLCKRILKTSDRFAHFQLTSDSQAFTVGAGQGTGHLQLDWGKGVRGKYWFQAPAVGVLLACDD